MIINNNEYLDNVSVNSNQGNYNAIIIVVVAALVVVLALIIEVLSLHCMILTSSICR